MHHRGSHQSSQNIQSEQKCKLLLGWQVSYPTKKEWKQHIKKKKANPLKKCHTSRYYYCYYFSSVCAKEFIGNLFYEIVSAFYFSLSILSFYVPKLCQKWAQTHRLWCVCFLFFNVVPKFIQYQHERFELHIHMAHEERNEKTIHLYSFGYRNNGSDSNQNRKKPETWH